jgi:hypothetical protein
MSDVTDRMLGMFKKLCSTKRREQKGASTDE